MLKTATYKIFKVLSPFKRYFHDIIVVFSGTAFAEIIPICIAPLLTRIYTPEDFGHFGFVTAFSSLLAQFSTLRYENSIIISHNPEETFRAGKLCQYLAIIIHLLFIIIMIGIYSIGGVFPEKYNWVNWFLFTPIVSFSSVLFRIQILLNNREERFKAISKVKISQGLSIAFLSIIFGMSGYVNNGLIWSLILSNFGGAFLLSHKKTNSPVIKIKELKELAKRYNNFPYYALPGELINNVTSQYPLMVFPFLFGSEITGYLTLAYRVVAMPVRFIITAVGEVFFQRASKEMRDKNNCRHLFMLTSGILLTISLISFGILYVLSDHIFEIFFGERWKSTGEYVKFLIPLFVISSVVSPLSSMIYVAEKQNWHLYWSIGTLFLMTISSLGSYTFFGNVKMVFIFFVMANSIAYFVYFLILFILTKGTLNEPKRR